jgi:predicted O-methyltransferase YrrM
MPAFTRDHTTRHIENWQTLFSPFAGRTNIHGIEIGCLEGRTSLWFFENLLTHHSSHLTCIDPHCHASFETNLLPFRERLSWIRLPSQLALRNRFDAESIHFVYIDGDHSASSVLEDAVLAFPLLLRGGIMLFDDYRWRSTHPLIPQTMPRLAIDAFLSVFSDKLVLLHKDYQVAVQKL